MAAETYTEVSRQSWGSRLGGAFKGIITGIILMVIAFVVLFWNEGRAVRRQKSLAEGSGVVISVAADRVDPGNEGKLIHASAMATTDEVLTDPQFGVSTNAISLARKVEMYQWQEKSESKTEKKLGGGTETKTTYSYERVWSDRPIDSSGFKIRDGHENPGGMPYEQWQTAAQRVSLGAFRLSPGLVGKMTRSEPVTVASLDDLPPELRYDAEVYNGGFYIGYDPGSPEIGDVRVTFQAVRPATVSIVSQQSGDSFVPYRAEAGSSIELLSYGAVSADAMFEAAQRSNTIMTWILRLVGFFLMFFGLQAIFRPLSVLADVVPAIGSLVGAGTSMVAFLIAAFLSLGTIAIAWLAYRPLLGGTVLAVAIAAAVLVVIKMRKAKPALAPAAAAPSATPPPPPPPPAG